MEEQICRICFEGGFLQGEGLIQPCHCTGSIAKVHRYCLQAWLGVSGRRTCDLCRFPYQTMVVNRPWWEFLVRGTTLRDLGFSLVGFFLVALVLALATGFIAGAVGNYWRYEGEGDCSEREWVQEVDATLEGLVTLKICIRHRNREEEGGGLMALVVLIGVMWMAFLFGCRELLE